MAMHWISLCKCYWAPFWRRGERRGSVTEKGLKMTQRRTEWRQINQRDWSQAELKEWKRVNESVNLIEQIHTWASILTHWPSLPPYATGQCSPFHPLSSHQLLPGRAEAGGEGGERESNGVQLHDEPRTTGGKDGWGRTGVEERWRGVFLATLSGFASIPAWLLREPLICWEVSFTLTLFLPYTFCLYNFLFSFCFKTASLSL